MAQTSSVLGLITAAALCGCNGGGSDSISADEATEILRAELFDDNGDDVIVFAAQDVGAGETIRSYSPDPAVTSDTVDVDADSWFFFIDDEPGARFNHPTRYALVNRETGDVSISDHLWWPVLEDGARFVDDDGYWDPDNWAYSTVQASDFRRFRRGALVPSLELDTGSAVTDGVKRALVVNGWETGETGKQGFFDDAKDLSTMFGYLDYSVERMGPQEEEASKKVGTSENIVEWIEGQAEELGEGDELLVYITAHGFTSDSTGLAMAGDIWEDELANALKKVDRRVTITVIVDACESGGFIDGLAGVADVAMTATDAMMSAWGDLDTNDPNPNDKGGEFSGSLCTALGDILADPELHSMVATQAAANGTSFNQALLQNAFDRSKMYDSALMRGKSNPQIGLGNATTRCGEGGIGDALGILLEDNAYECRVGQAGNTSTHSDGVQMTQAEGECDSVATVSTTVTLDCDQLANFECGEGAYGTTICAPETAPCTETSEYKIVVNVVNGLVPFTSATYDYQIGFVFDSDNDTTNNYQPDSLYPKDSYIDTDLWYSLLYYRASGWSLSVADATESVVPAPSAARVLMTEDAYVLIAPASEFATSDPGHRTTLFRHEGLWGMGDDWSMDVVPTVDEPLATFDHE